MNLVEIVAKIKDKDENAQIEFYKETYKVAYSIAYNMTKNDEDAMDILQDAYITAYSKIESLNDPEKAVSWFNMIVNNKCKDYLKKKKPTLFNEMDTDEFEFEDTLENENNEFVPEEAIDYSETKKLMMKILDELPEDQKLCLLMYYYEDLTVKEIAESLDCTENTVKSRLNYGRKKIKEGVLDLEKKGTKLYGVAPLPFIVWMLKGTEETYAASNVLYAKITAETQAISAAASTATSSAGTKAAISEGVKTAAAAGGKGVATKVIIGVVVAGLALGGGFFAGKAFNKSDVPKEVEKVELTVEEKEDKIISQLDYEYLRKLLIWTPTYNEEEPVTDEEMWAFIWSSMLYGSMEGYDKSIITKADFIEQVENEDFYDTEADFYSYYKVNGDEFNEAARVLSFNKQINEEFIDNTYDTQFNPMLEWDDGAIKLVVYTPTGIHISSEVEIGETRKVDGRVEVDYIYMETAYEETTTEYRTAYLEYTEDGYVITKVTER